MKLLRFYLRVFKIAITHSIEKTHVIVLFLVIAAGALGANVPPVRDVLHDWVVTRIPEFKDIEGPESWQVLLAVFAFVAVVRLIAAPFWLWQSEREKLQAAEAEVADLRRQLDPRAKNKAIREGLACLLAEGGRLAGICEDEQQEPPEQLTVQWDKSTEEFLRAQLDESFVTRFRNFAGLSLYSLGRGSPERGRLWSQIQFRLMRLNEFMRELAP